MALRITALFALGALLISIAVAFSAFWFTTRLLVNEQQTAALRQTYVNAAIAKTRLAAPDHDVPTLLDDITTTTSTQKVIYTGGRWFSSSLLVSRDALPQAIRSEAMAGHTVWEWAEVAGKNRIVVGVPLPALQSAYFQVFDESPLQRTATILRTVLIIAAAIATAAGALCGWAASRRLTAPLRAVTRAARSIAAGDLDTHLPDERDRELAQLVDSFNAMVSVLKQRIERDARFAADVSHELRSPLTTLTTSVSVLRGRRDELSARGQQALQLISTELSHFVQLVDDLLEISRGDTQSELADPEPVRISQLILNLLEREPYRDIKAEFDGDALDAFVLGDKRRLEQVFRNILDNAIRYAGGATQISAHTDNGDLVLYVDDAGPGIPLTDRDHVFERFTRTRNTRRATHTGTGLGLALVHQHIGAHHGHVWIADAPGGGARFGIRLPRSTP